MTNIWDIAQHVDDHPDDHTQRWRLAKKLYKACEYSVALEHLEFLAEQSDKTINLMRYLAASHFRLQEYDEATATLREALDTWPDELSLREQLARVLEVSGDRPGAAEVWDAIAARTPGYRLASVKSHRLRTTNDAEEDDDSEPQDSDADLGSDLDRICPFCGASNNEEFDRCWQCRGQLGDRTEGSAASDNDSEPHDHDAQWFLLGGLSIVGLLSGALYLTLTDLMHPAEFGDDINALLSTRLLTARIVIGTVLLAAWPIALGLSSKLLRCPPRATSTITMVGLLLATLSYLVTWLPAATLPYAVFIVTVTALLLIGCVFRGGVFGTLGMMALSTTVAAAAALASFIILEGPMPLIQSPAIVSHLRLQESLNRSGTYKLPVAATPVYRSIRLVSTGSSWLDAQLNTIGVDIKCTGTPAALTAELKIFESEMLVYKKSTAGKVQFTCENVVPGEAYTLSVTSKEGAEIEVVLRSTLLPQIGEEIIETKAPSLNDLYSPSLSLSQPGGSAPSSPQGPRAPGSPRMPGRP